jgi:hypothetical protein
MRQRAEARVALHPEYVAALLAGGRHMHKDDMKELEVIRVKTTDPSGIVKSEDLPAILRRKPVEAERLDRLADLIRSKETKRSQYRADLSHMNLIVVDHYDTADRPSSEYSVADAVPSKVRESLSTSSFREIFVASRHPDGGWQYLALNMLVLMEGFYLFASACAELSAAGRLNGEIDVHAIFLGARNESGFRVSTSRKTETKDM